MDAYELLPWGLTWEQLAGIAATAARVHWSRTISFDERYTAAMDGVTMAVAESMLPPTRRDLMIAGAVAISEAVTATRKLYGLPQPDTRCAGQPRKRYDMYWRTGDRLQCPFTDGIEERVAAHQVWDRLGAGDQNTLDALGEYGDERAAAGAMGLTRSSYAHRLMKARQNARELWYDWESDPGHYGRGRSRNPDVPLSVRIRKRVDRHRSINRLKKGISDDHTIAERLERPCA